VLRDVRQSTRPDAWTAFQPICFHHGFAHWRKALPHPCRGGAAFACGWGHPQSPFRNVAQGPALPPILPKQKSQDRSMPALPSCPCRAGGVTRPCACLSTPPRFSAVRRDWGLSLKLSTEPRKAPRSTRAAGFIIRFVGQSIPAQAISAKRFFCNGRTGLRRARGPSTSSIGGPVQGLDKFDDFFVLWVFAMAKLLSISPLTDRRRDTLVGNSSTVERRTLTPLILVRIQVPQPILPKSLDSHVFPSYRIPFWRHRRPDAQN
jgi:hypothetical protein